MPVDFSPLTGPVADNGTTKGLAAFGDALEAVLQRRAMLQRQQQEIAAQKQAAALVDQRQREMQAAQLEQQQEQQKRIAEHERATEANAKRTLDIQERTHQAATMGKVPDMVAKGQGAAVPSLLAAAGAQVSQKPVPDELRRPIENPMAAMQGVPFMGAMGDAGAAVAAPLEAQRQKDVRGYDNKAVVDFGGGRTSDLDMGPLGPEARAEMMRKSLAGLPADNPFVAQAQKAIPVLTGGGMIKPGDENNIYRDATREAAADARSIRAANAQRGARDPRLKQSIVTGWEGAYTHWEDNANVNKLTDVKTVADRASGLIDQYHKSGATISQRAALYQTARDITGPGVLTENEFKKTVTGTTGFLGYLKSKAAQFEAGDISDQEMQALENYIKDSQAIIRKKAAAAVHNFDTRFGPKTQYGSQVPEDVGASRSALIDRFGLQPSDLEGHKKGKSGAEELADKILGGGK